jgi:hypothetical protein
MACVKHLSYLRPLPTANFNAAGSGKTILASTIIEAVGRSCTAAGHHIPVLYFFFDFNDPNKQKAEDMVKSLIWQLAAKSKPTVAFLQALYSEHHVQPVKTTLPIKTWTDILLKLLLKQHDCYIIIDALDECTEIPELWKAIILLLNAAKPSIK